MTHDESILRVENLRVEFRARGEVVTAVDGVSFSLKRGETLGIVGESGSGKSVTNLALMGLIPQPPGRIVSGTAWYRGQDLLRSDLSAIRGNRIAMIFQDPMTALNPFLTIGEQLTEVTRWHFGWSLRKATARAVELLEQVGIPGAATRMADFPHQFSGGMRQRVLIAMALSCEPDILIADEPTTALDVTIQAQILDLMKHRQQESGTAIILITHDLGVVASACRRVLVMYAGRIVEQADAVELFAQPRHPYTMGLLSSIPRWNQPLTALQAIPGQPPDLARLPPGCPFAPRCRFVHSLCLPAVPPLVDRVGGGRVACVADFSSSRAQ